MSCLHAGDADRDPTTGDLVGIGQPCDPYISAYLPYFMGLFSALMFQNGRDSEGSAGVNSRPYRPLTPLKLTYRAFQELLFMVASTPH